MTFHVLRALREPDPFAPECGCELAACGFVIPDPDCPEHGGSHEFPNSHPAAKCKAERAEAKLTGKGKAAARRRRCCSCPKVLVADSPGTYTMPERFGPQMGEHGTDYACSEPCYQAWQNRR